MIPIYRNYVGGGIHLCDCTVVSLSGTSFTDMSNGHVTQLHAGMAASGKGLRASWTIQARPNMTVFLVTRHMILCSTIRQTRLCTVHGWLANLMVGHGTNGCSWSVSESRSCLPASF